MDFSSRGRITILRTLRTLLFLRCARLLIAINSTVFYSYNGYLSHHAPIRGSMGKLVRSGENLRYWWQPKGHIRYSKCVHRGGGNKKKMGNRLCWAKIFIDGKRLICLQVMWICTVHWCHQACTFQKCQKCFRFCSGKDSIRDCARFWQFGNYLLVKVLNYVWEFICKLIILYSLLFVAMAVRDLQSITMFWLPSLGVR